MQNVGRFQLKRLLGRGTAEVYLAWDPVEWSDVALKLIPLTAGQDVLEGERRGAKLQKEVSQRVPEVARVFDVGEADGFLWVAMEYVSGPPLSELLAERGRLDAHLAVDVSLQLCRVLEAFQSAAEGVQGHRGPLIHGDLKPENVRMEGRLRVRLLDFGLARRLERPDEDVTSEFGSLPYASPERLRHGVLSPAADLWSVAVMLYEMATGRLPFPGQSDEEVRQRIVQGGGAEPPDQDIVPELAAILERALDREPGRRFQTANDLRRALEAVPLETPQDLGKTRRVAPPTPSPQPQPAEVPGGKPGKSAAGPSEALHERATRQPAAAIGSAGLPAPSRPRRTPRRRRAIRWAPVILSVLLLPVLAVAIAVGLQVQSVAARIEGSLAGPDVELAPLVESFLAVERLDFLGSLDSLAPRLEERLVAATESTVRSAREGQAQASEAWAQAAGWMALAQRIGGVQDHERAWEAFCEAQRLHGEALDLVRRGEASQARELWVLAERSFGEAARYAMHSAVPHLGLVGMYLTEGYGLPVDSAALEAALRAATRRELDGLTAAEHRLLMRGHARLGEERLLEAVEETARAERVDHLTGARDHYQAALAHCRSSGDRDCEMPFVRELQRIRAELHSLGYLS